MLVFVHMHKCAGSAVRIAAQKTGLQLPVPHKNGYALDAEGKAVKFARMSREGFHAFIGEKRAAGVQFLAMEWDFPRFEHFEGLDVKLFTVLRHPLERAISNYRFAKLRGETPRDYDFRQACNMGFTKSGSLYRSANYFARKICTLGSTAPMGDAEQARAIMIFRRFRSVIVLGEHDFAAELARLGLHKLRAANVTDEMKNPLPLAPEELAVSAEDRAWFLEHNRIDSAVVAAFLPPEGGYRPATGDYSAVGSGPAR